VLECLSMKKIHIFKREQVADVLESIYDGEVHCTLLWEWDFGFEFRLDAVSSGKEILYVNEEVALELSRKQSEFEPLPSEIEEILEDIDNYKIEEVVSALAYAVYKVYKPKDYCKWYEEMTNVGGEWMSLGAWYKTKRK